MTIYIKLEDVHKLYCEPRTKFPTDEEFDFLERINSLPSINIEEIIEEEIKELKFKTNDCPDSEVKWRLECTIAYFEMLLQKFKS